MEPTIDYDFVDKILPSTISLVVTGVFAVIIGVYLEKFKSRVTTISYEIIFNPLATSSHTDYWGEIEVHHNKRLINHLNFITVKLKNDSNNDLQNLNIDFNVDQNSQILGQSGQYDNTKSGILIEQQHYSYFVEVSNRNQVDFQQKLTNPNHQTPAQLTTELQYIMTNKKFNLPVFNRHTSVTINMLVENFSGVQPEVNVGVIHKGVKLEQKEDETTELGKTVIYSSAIGVVIFGLFVYAIARTYPTATKPLIITAILGITASLLGLGVLKVFRFLKKILS
ncbi:MAG: hypothetical protein K2U26_13950 [Cyclobacteriaceae bacterium]|nr:hypothetical protein [Cyclobacteriaceae bacterium]